MNIYSVYSKYFGFKFFQGYMNKFVFRSVRKSKVPLYLKYLFCLGTQDGDYKLSEQLDTH